MKIAYLASGAAGMYCGTCLHDNTLARALLARGDEVLLIPTYTPLRTDEQDVSQSKIFLGGINVYLQQKSALFRHMPWFVDALLDCPSLIRWATKGASSVDPAQLGDLTVSMLLGANGHQRKEINKLLQWLSREVRPDVVHLSHALLLGLATEIDRVLQVPVVCSLMGEDVFLERISEPHYSECRALMRQHARRVAAFTAMNRYYADYMADYLQVDPARTHIIRHGLDLNGHGQRRGRRGDQATVVGYLARIHRDKGLHLLVDAFIRLARDPAFSEVRLEMAGYLAAGDRGYLDEQLRKLRDAGLAERVAYRGEPDRAGKIAFLQSLDLMCVPTVYRESKGLSLLEALANGVPIVVPRHGTFPELVSDTQAGLLHEPEDVDSLEAALRQMILDAEGSEQMGQRGQEAIRDRYHAPGMAEQTAQLYRRVTRPLPSDAPAAASPVT